LKNTHRFISSLIVSAASLVAVTGVQAQSSTPASGSGFSVGAPGNSYVGFGAGRSDYSLGNGIGIFDSSEGDTAYNIRAGSYFSNNFGFEAGYTDFGSVNRAGGSTKANGINLSLIGKMPLSESFNLLGKVGTTYGRTKVSSATGSGVAAGDEKGFGLSYGVGAEYLITPQWSAALEYDSHKLKFAGGNDERVGVTTLSARYRF
jgi:opacity protein-like surface antigen